MTLSDLLESLSGPERDFIAGLDYGRDFTTHCAALDIVIRQGGALDFDTQGYWYPYEVIELGKNWLQEGHEREYAACLGTVLLNIGAGRDLANDVESIVERHHDSGRRLPEELRQLIDSMISGVRATSGPGSSPGPPLPATSPSVPTHGSMDSQPAPDDDGGVE